MSNTSTDTNNIELARELACAFARANAQSPSDCARLADEWNDEFGGDIWTRPNSRELAAAWEAGWEDWRG